MAFFRKEKGFVSLFITLGVMLIALAIPVTVKLVEQRQEIRSKAMQADDGGGGSEEVAPAQSSDDRQEAIQEYREARSSEPQPAQQEERSQSGSDLPSGYHPESQPAQEQEHFPSPTEEENQRRNAIAADNARRQEEEAERQRQQEIEIVAKAAADQAAAQEVAQNSAAQNVQRQAADNAAQQVADQAAEQAKLNESAQAVAQLLTDQTPKTAAVEEIPQPTPTPTAAPTPAPTLTATLTFTSTPAPEIQATIPLGGGTVGYGSISPVYGEYPSKADIALDKELEGISNAALFVAGTSLAGAGMAVAAPEVAAAAINAAVTIAPTVQTVGVASTKIGMGMAGAGITGQVVTGLYRGVTGEERETSPDIINMIDDASRFSQETGAFLAMAGPLVAWSGAAVRASFDPPRTYYHYTTTENAKAIAEEGFNIQTFSGRQQTAQILKNATSNPSGVKQLLHVNNFEGASVYVTDVPPNKASAVPTSFLGRIDDGMNRMLRNSSSFGISNPKQLEAYFTIEPQGAGLVKQTLSNWTLGVPEWKIPTTNLSLTDPRFKISGPFYR